MKRKILALTVFLGLAGRALTAAPIQVHTYTAGPADYDANAFWLESDSGLVLIDALLQKSEARRLVATMKATGKPLAGIFLTHPHLDHFGGLRTVLAAFGPVPVYATKATAEGVKPAHDKAMAQGWPQQYGDEYEQNVFVPDHLVTPGAPIELAGMKFVVQDYGPVESANNSVIHNLDLNVLFTGDATVSHAAFYVGEGHSAQALEALPRLAADFPKVVRAYSGHYGPMALQPMVAENLDEVRYARSLVTMALAEPSQVTEKGELTEAARTEVIQALAARLRHGGTYGMNAQTLAQMNVAGIEPEMVAARDKTAVSTERRELAEGLRPMRFLIGRWAGSQSTPSAALPAGTPVPPKTPFELRMAPGSGGAFLEGTTRIGPFGFQFTMTYDRFQKIYRMAAIDDVSGQLDLYQGNFDAQGNLVLSNVTAGTYYLAKGQQVLSRLTFQPQPGGLWRWQLEESRDGNKTWKQVLTLEIERRLP